MWTGEGKANEFTSGVSNDVQIFGLDGAVRVVQSGASTCRGETYEQKAATRSSFTLGFYARRLLQNGIQLCDDDEMSRRQAKQKAGHSFRAGDGSPRVTLSWLLFKNGHVRANPMPCRCESIL